MLNEITFQRKKELSSYTQPIQSDQSKTIYDFVLKQDTQIKSLEKEISNLKNDILLLSSKVPLLESKSNDQITKTDLNILLPTIPTKEEIKSMIKIELEKSKEKEEIQRTIDSIKKENETTKKEISSINKKIGIIEKNINSKLKENEKEDNTNVIIEQVNKAIGGIEKKTFTITSQLKQNIEEYIIKTNKKLSDFDNDFDRLIESLKTQFQSVNDTILQLDKTKLDIKDISKYISEPRASTPMTYLPNTQNNLFDNFRFHTIEPSTTKSQKVSNLSSSIFDQFDTNIRNAKTINSNQMKQDLIALKHDIISDFEKINNKILNELQNQANDIKTLYSELHQNELTDGDSMKLSSLIYQLDSEVNKKANIEQLNYALEAQAKINDAFCSANKLARWSWGDDGLVNENGIIIWTIQNINTSLDVFSWENESETIYVNVKGIYRISAGVVFTKNDKKRKIYININNETEMISNDEIPNDESSLIYVEKYFALGDETKIQVGVIMDKKKEEDIKFNINGECNAEGFLEIKKVI